MIKRNYSDMLQSYPQNFSAPTTTTIKEIMNP